MHEEARETLKSITFHFNCSGNTIEMQLESYVITVGEDGGDGDKKNYSWTNRERVLGL